MSLCILCGTSVDVKRCETASFYGAPTLQDKYACGECFREAIRGKKQDVTQLSTAEKIEKAARERVGR